MSSPFELFAVTPSLSLYYDIANKYKTCSTYDENDNLVCDENEIALILKTNESLVDKVISRVKEIHSYDCPCILAFPANSGNPEFISWILEETNI